MKYFMIIIIAIAMTFVGLYLFLYHLEQEKRAQEINHAIHLFERQQSFYVGMRHQTNVSMVRKFQDSTDSVSLSYWQNELAETQKYKEVLESGLKPESPANVKPLPTKQ